jgi:hypothetical protein
MGDSDTMCAMKRLYTFLMISILFSHSAWAFHDIEINQLQEQAYSQSSDQNDNVGDYDHCGHTSAHLVGLLSNNTIDTYVAPNRKIISIKNTVLSISYQPPVPPPTV